MADNTTDQPTSDNGQEGGDKQPRYRINLQYVKDLSFENPNAPRSLVASAQTRPDINVSVNVTAQSLGGNVFETILQIAAQAKTEDNSAFLCELSYAGVFTLDNFPENQVQPFLLIEAPRILFPFARRIIADATRDGGFPPLMLEPIDFVQIYKHQQQQGGVNPAENETKQ